ncbi:MAG: DNA methyltransferase, partial [Verrucomicrobiota bacterium]
MTTLATAKAKDEELTKRFASKMEVNIGLKRTLVSFQANKTAEGHRWFKYKEGFSAQLLHYLFRHLEIESGKILDPFAGAGTTLFVASQLGIDSVGIELLPIGQEIIEARKSALNVNREAVVQATKLWRKSQPWKKANAKTNFPHLRITNGAFSPETEESLCRYLSELENEENCGVRKVLRFAALCVLEQISFTRKDGQYLRWDYRSGRKQGATPFDKGRIESFDTAIDTKLGEIIDDLEGDVGLLDLFPTGQKFGEIEVIGGSCLEVLPKLETHSFDGLITSPPYCNRYDYTRTYALELALL